MFNVIEVPKKECSNPKGYVKKDNIINEFINIRHIRKFLNIPAGLAKKYLKEYTLEFIPNSKNTVFRYSLEVLI